MRNFGRGTKFYQKAVGEKRQQANNTFEEEKRGPFGHVEERKEDASEAKEEPQPSASSTKIELLPKRSPYAQVRNHSASAHSSSQSSGSGNYKIEFDDKDRIKDSYSSNFNAPRSGTVSSMGMGIKESVSSQMLAQNQRALPGAPSNLERRLHELEASSQGQFGEGLSRQERQDAIRQHNAQLDTRKGKNPGKGAYGGGSQWAYDPDEENTPSQHHSIELKPMSLAAATGVGEDVTFVRESPLQNHYISSAGRPSQTSELPPLNDESERKQVPFSTEDFDQMFAQADAKARDQRQATDINVSMAHAGSSDGEGQGGPTRQSKHKSRIGAGHEKGALHVASSKAAKVENREGGSLNSEAAKTLTEFLDQKTAQKAEPKPQQRVSSNEQQLENHMKTQREEAKARKDHKLSTQLKKDTAPALREREVTAAASKAAKQLEQRRKKKEEEMKASGAYRSVQAYNVGDGLGAKAQSFFTRGGREQSNLESENIRGLSVKQLATALHDEDHASSKSSSAGKDNLTLGVKEYLAGRHRLEPEERKTHARFDEALEQSRRALVASQPTGYYEHSSIYDTIHPSKLGQDRGAITDVRQNMLMSSLQQAQLESLGRGLTGTSLGYGSGNALSGYQLGAGGLGGFSSSQSRQQDSRFDRPNQQSSSTGQQNQIGQSQFRYTGNAAADNRQETFGGDRGLQNAFTSQSKQVFQKTPTTAQFSSSKGANQSQARNTQSIGGANSQQHPAGKASYFYESGSKVISLKKFSDDLQFSGSSSAQSIYSSKNRQANKDISLMKWFEKLLNHEKAIVLTVVDTELVHLLRQMHSVYAQYGHGHFQSDYPGQVAHSPQESDRYEKVGSYSLLFQKPSFSNSLAQHSGHGAHSSYGGLNADQPYDWYGPQSMVKQQEASNVQSKIVKEQQTVEDNLIHNINLIKVGGEEAITLNNELLENTDFLLKMMQTIDPSFMHSELKIERTDVATAMKGSVLQSKHEAASQEDSQHQTTSRKQQGRTREPDLFFTLNERDGKAVNQTSTGVAATDFRSRTSQYSKMGIKSHPQQTSASSLDPDSSQGKSRLTFAQVLSHIFERAINVQYQEFQGKLSNHMKDFFFLQGENHIYNDDVKLAKFWRDLRANEQAEIWDKVTEAGEKIIREVRGSEAFKKSKGFEDIQEEPNDCEDDSAEEARSYSYRKRQSASKLKPEIFTETKDSSKNPGEWKKQMKQVQSEINERRGTIDAQASRLAQTSKLTRQYVDWDQQDGSEEEKEKKGGKRARPEADSEDTDSDDIEKNYNQNYNQGYKLLQSRETSGNHRQGVQAPRGLRIPNYAQVQGQGYRALDSNNSSNNSRTVTESEDSDNNHNTQHSYQTQDYLKAVYSTKMDKELSEGEIDFDEARGQKEDSDRYASNYDSDEFEDEDPDDDFNLPRNHLQNNEAYGQQQTNIKAQILKKGSFMKTANSRKPEFISTGSQVTNLIGGKTSQKSKDKSKPAKALEEQKQMGSKASKAQLVQNQEAQKELQIRTKFKEVIDKLRETGAKAISSTDMNNCYLFIRSISTSASFASLTRIKDGFYLEQGLQELYGHIYKILYAQQEAKLISDLLDHNDKGGKATNSGAANVGQANQPTQGNAAKKNKKKNKKEKAAKEQAEKQQLDKEAEKVVEVIDDIVIVSDKPRVPQEEAKNDEAQSSEQPGEQTKAKSQIRRRKNKKKKKAPLQNAEDQDKYEPGSEAQAKAEELTPHEFNEYIQRLGGQQSLEEGSDVRNFSVPEQLVKSAEKKARDAGEMLQPTPLENVDYVEHLMTSSAQSLEERKRELRLLEDQDQQIAMHDNNVRSLAKQVLLDGHMTDSMSNMSSFSQPHARSDLHVELSHEKVKKSIAERTSLLHGDVQYDKYPEINESGKMKALDLKEADDDLAAIGDELSQDEDVKMFPQVGLRKRNPADVKRSQEDLANGELPGYKQVMRENAMLLAGLTDINDQLIDIGDHSTSSLAQKKQPDMKFTDLREEKLLKEKQRQQQLQQLKHVSDYSEKAAEVPGDEGEADAENKDQRKKKKKKRKSKKKAGANEGEAAQDGELKFPESIEEAGKQLVRGQLEHERIHRQKLEEQGAEWANMVQRVLAEEKRSENMDDDASSDQNKFFDDDFMEREEIVGPLRHKYGEDKIDQIVSHESINLDFDSDEQIIKPQRAITVDLERCKQQYAAANRAASASISMLDKVRDLQPEHPVGARLLAGGINDSSDLNNRANIDLTKRLAQNCASINAGGQFSSIDPVIPLYAKDSIDEEIPEELPAADLNDEPSAASEKQTPAALNKKKQAKADKKKEAKQNGKLKAQQLKQKDVEMKAQKEQKRKELQEEKNQLMSQSKQATEPKENEEEETIENLQQIIKTQRTDLKMPGLNVLNQQEGRAPSHSSSVVRAQSKRVQFQRDASYDGSAKIPKRGSSRGTSIASSNKNKQDDILQELDGLFAQEYKKPQQSIIESLNTSKKNTPDNSSSKQNKVHALALNDQILQQKLEDLQLATEEHRKPKGNARSSSLPLNQARSTSNERKLKPEEPKQDSSRPVQAAKKEKQTKEKQKILLDQSYAQILPQPSIEIIKPEPKLTKQQKKKLDKNQQEAQGLKADKSSSLKNEGTGKEKTQNTHTLNQRGVLAAQPASGKKEKLVSNVNAVKDKGQLKEANQGTQLAKPGEEVKVSTSSRKKQKKQAPQVALSNMQASQDQSAQPALYNNAKDASNVANHPFNFQNKEQLAVNKAATKKEQKVVSGPGARQSEPAVGQQRLQQLLMGEPQMPLYEEAKRSNAAAEPGSLGSSRVQTHNQRQGNPSTNSKAVAQGQMDHSQILKNIETYNKKQGFQSQGLLPQANNHLMSSGPSQNQNVSPAQYFMEQGLNFNQMLGNQMMNPNQMFMPTAPQTAQQPVALPEQNSQGTPGQTINIDIISISYQQTMQQANPGQPSSGQQTNIFNLQNKQVTTNNSTGQAPPWQLPSPQLALPPNPSSTQQVPNTPSPQQINMVNQAQSQQFAMGPSNLGLGNTSQFGNQNAAQQYLGLQGQNYNFQGQGLNPQNYMNYGNMGFPTQFPPNTQGNQNHPQAMNPNFNSYYNSLTQLNAPGNSNQQMSNYNNMFMSNQYTPNQNQFMNQGQQNMAAYAAAQQTKQKQSQQMAAAANAVAAAQNMMAVNSGGSAGGSPSQAPFMPQNNQQQQMNMLSQFNMFQQMMNQQNGMNNQAKAPQNVMTQNMNSFLQNQQNQFLKQMQQQVQQQQQQMLKSSQQSMAAMSQTSSPSPPGAQGVQAAQQNQVQVDLSQIDSTGRSSLQPQPTLPAGAKGHPVPVKISDQLDRNHLSESSSAFIPTNIRNQANSSQRAQLSTSQMGLSSSKLPTASKNNAQQMFQHGIGASRGTPDQLSSGQTQFGGGQQQLFQPQHFVPNEATMQGMGQSNFAAPMQNPYGGHTLPPSQAAMARGMQQHGGQPLPSPGIGSQQNYLTPQQEYLMKIQQLQSQSYGVLSNQQDQAALFMLNQQELSHVHEFYEVLDAQIERVKDDQSSKLRKADQLRDIAFNLIKSKILQVYELKQRAKGLDSSTLSNVKVEIYGSMATGLAIDSSDLDILVQGFILPDSPRYQKLSREELIEELQMLHSALNDVFAIKQNNLIETASVPVIKLQMNLVQICQSERQKNSGFEINPEHLDEETKVLHIDITLDEPKNSGDQQHLGIQCCKYIKARIEEYPALKILALIFKKFLSLKNLNKPYAGGLSSYSLIQMILAILKLIEKETGLTQPSLSISMIFKKLVWEYGCNFLPQVRAISQHCQIQDRSTLGYILHSPQCSINTEFDGDSLQYEDECDCGYTLMHSNQGDEGLAGAAGKDQQTLIDLLQKLIHKEETHKARPPLLPQTTAHHYSPTLIIVDPINRFNNIGKSSYNFAMIQQEFRDVYQRLNDEMVLFVRSCCQKQNGAGMPQPFDVDGLISRVLQIDYKLSTPAPFLEDPLVKEAAKTSESKPVLTTSEPYQPADKKSPGSTKASKKTPPKPKIDSFQLPIGNKVQKLEVPGEEAKKSAAREETKEQKRETPSGKTAQSIPGSSKPVPSQIAPGETKKGKKGKNQQKKQK